MRLARRSLLLLAVCLLASASAAALAFGGPLDSGAEDGPLGPAAAETSLTLAATSAGIGGAVHATATLSGGVTPMNASISFSAFAPSDPTCSGAAVFTDTVVNVTDNGEYSSANFTPTEAGAYKWSADYSGDVENNPALASCTATSTISQATPGIATTATNATVGGTIADSATLSAGVNPTGTLVFKAFGPDDATCANAAAFEKTVTVSGNAVYGSTNFTTVAAGAYIWTAEYSGDTNNAPASSACNAPNETSTVAKALPGLATTASNATVGGTIADSATLSAGVTPTGSLTFKAFGPNDATCTNAAAFEMTVTVNGNGAYGSTNFTTTAAGSYRWTAAYSGDANNEAASSGCNAANETSTVAKASTGLATTASNGTAGGTIADSATLSAGVTPTGSILFKAFGPSDTTCALTPVFEKSVTVNGNGAYGSTNFAVSLAGAYRWTAAYSGDANNNGVTSGCNAPNETSTVAKASPGLTTTAGNATVGASISDSATIAGVNPTGSILFKAFGPGDTTCSLTAAFQKTVTVSGNGSYDSTGFLTTAAGSYRWTAAYSGDANNSAVTSACNDANETSTVAKATPGLVSSASSAPFGFAISDSATLSGGFSPTGSLTFKAFGPNDATCTNAAAFQKTVTVTSANPNYSSGDFNGAALGDYRWTIAYSGDADNNAVTAACNAPNETSTVGNANPSLTTTAASATIGSPISDSATLSGGFSPTGSIQFKAFGPGDTTCSLTPAFSVGVSVSGNGVYSSTNFTPTQLGTYLWTASYSGDANNNPASSGCGAANEASLVSKFAPTLSASASSAPIGSPIADITSFSGGSNRTGQIVFRAYGPNDPTCALAPAFASSVAVTPGNGTYASGPFTPDQAGAYRWTATYSGDAINAATTSPCAAATALSNVAAATPTLSAKVAAASLEIGSAAHDTATLSGGHQPTGTITFRLFGPGDAGCASPPVFTGTATVAANGTASSPGFAPAAPGQYRFTATYPGDRGNDPVATPCATASQLLTVSKRVPSLTARVSLRGSGRIAVRANLAGAAAPKGKLLFQLFGPDNSRCTGKPAFSQRVTVRGGGSYAPSAYRARAPGVYRLTVAYPGDAWNKPVRSGCNAAGQSVRVRSK
ncbi:MAG: beta strand repeat-containing protein [Solirubrobacterales bacterium]